MLKELPLYQFLEDVPDTVDVGDDYADDFLIAYEPPVRLTKYAKILFSPIMDKRVRFDDKFATVLGIESEAEHKLCRYLFEAIAGYCPLRQWDRMFYYED